MAKKTLVKKTEKPAGKTSSKAQACGNKKVRIKPVRKIMLEDDRVMNYSVGPSGSPKKDE